MTTDADRAFETWWNGPGDDPVAMYAAAPHKRASYTAWRAAVAWATARERGRAAKVAERYPLPSAPRVPGMIAAAIRCDVGGIPLAPFPADDSKAPDAGGKPITLTYRNHRGEVSERTITPKRVWYGSTEWHPEPQWLLSALDHDKGADRDFALKDFGAAASVQLEPPADLVDLARERFGSHSSSPLPAAFAAFAAEYAAKIVAHSGAAFKAVEDYWKTAYNEAAKQTIEAKYAQEAAERALAEEREACAKVAEAFTPADHIAYDMRVGSFPRQSHAGAAIAAAIRARKGGENGV